MKEHIQEVNLLDSFFIRYKNTYAVKRAHTTQGTRNRDRDMLKEQVKIAKLKTQNRHIEPKEEVKAYINDKEGLNDRDFGSTLEATRDETFKEGKTLKTRDTQKKEKKHVRVISHHTSPEK